MKDIGLENGQLNANKTDSKECNSELVEREEVENTPFTVITAGSKTFGVMGMHRITEYGTKEEIRKELKEITWNRLIQVIMLLTEAVEVNNLMDKKQ